MVLSCCFLFKDLPYDPDVPYKPPSKPKSKGSGRQGGGDANNNWNGKIDDRKPTPAPLDAAMVEKMRQKALAEEKERELEKQERAKLEHDLNTGLNSNPWKAKQLGLHKKTKPKQQTFGGLNFKKKR